MKTKHVCLIVPPSPFLTDERVFLHLGILKVAAALEKEKYNIDFLDLAGVDNYSEVIKHFISQNPEVCIFGITATTPQIPYAMEIADSIRESQPEAKIILGGTHVSLMNSARKKGVGRAIRDIKSLHETFDVLVAGDGELAILEALQFNHKLVDADNRKSDLFLTNEMLTSLPLPARHLVDIDSYKYTIDGENATSLICQLGCPFGCTFCGGRNSNFLRSIRTRSSESVVSEIEHLYKKYNFSAFMFYDDELNVNKEWESFLNKIIKLQQDLGADFKLRGFVKAELFTEEQAALMYTAGFRWLLTGFESGDERILGNIRKGATIEENTRCIKFAKEAGLKVKALMSIGHAGETEESIQNTKDWLLEVKPEEFDCTIITVYPGSPYFDEAVSDGEKYTYVSPVSGDKLYQKDLDYRREPDYYKGDPEGGYISYVWTDTLEPADLVNKRDLLEKEVRTTLGIPFNRYGEGVHFEHSMGQGNISSTILKRNY